MLLIYLNVRPTLRMTKFFIGVFLMCCICLGIFWGKGISHTHPSLSKISALQPPSPSSNQPGIPTKLTITKINLTTAIEPIGQDKEGLMDVPKNPQNTGWYSLGFKPGDKGSAVIDGHLDTSTGAPAAFWSLSKLSLQDEIIVTDTKNTSRTFVVTDIQTYEYNQVPLQKIFATTDKARVNLITCIGVFDKQTKNYSKRIVVYAEKK